MSNGLTPEQDMTWSAISDAGYLLDCLEEIARTPEGSELYGRLRESAGETHARLTHVLTDLGVLNPSP